jgi:hypothetical protein
MGGELVSRRSITRWASSRTGRTSVADEMKILIDGLSVFKGALYPGLATPTTHH